MNISHAFATYMATKGYGTLGTNLFIGAVPIDAPNVCWWVSASGGSNTTRNKTGERIKQYIIQVFYRSMDAEDMYEKMQAFEETINSNTCTSLTGYDTIDMQCTTFPTDQDIDSEERTKGLAQVTLTIYS